MKSTPQWFMRFSQLQSYRKTREEPYDLLFYLSRHCQAMLYYTLNSELKPSSYLATFDNEVVLFRYTNYPSDGFVVSVDIANCSVTYLLQVIDGELIEDDSLQCVKSNCVVDLTPCGDRWEGQTLDGRPFGWGSLFDSNDHLVYLGFMFGSARICYGSTYYHDLAKEVVRYQGNYGWNEAFGYGTRFDRCSRVVVEGEWVSDHPSLSRSVNVERDDGLFPQGPTRFYMERSSCGMDSLSCMESPVVSPIEDPTSSLLLTSLTEELVIGDHCCNDLSLPSLDLSFLLGLRSFSVGKESFLFTRSFTVRGLPHLRTLSIGRRSFQESHVSSDAFAVVDCPQLHTIDVDSNCFSSYRHCELRQLPSLQTLRIGSGDPWAYCFKYCREFHLVHFPMLQHVAIGGHSFASVRSIRFENLPAVERIECDRCSLQGDLACDVSENRLVMKDLPSLGELSLGMDCMSHIGCVVIDNVPNTERVWIGQDSLYFTQCVYARKAEQLQRKIASRRSIVQRSLVCE